MLDQHYFPKPEKNDVIDELLQHGEKKNRLLHLAGQLKI